MPGHGYSFALSKVGISRDVFPPAYFVKCCPSNVLLTPIWPVYRPHLRYLTSLGLCQHIRVIACPENRNEKCLIVKFYGFFSSNKKDWSWQSKNCCWHLPRHVSWKGALHEGDEKPAQYLWSASRIWQGMSPLYAGVCSQDSSSLVIYTKLSVLSSWLQS